MRGVTTRRDLLLAAAGLVLAPPAFGMAESHDVSYGVGPNRAALEARHAAVARLLGPGVARHLVVVALDDDRYALVYRRGGDLESTRVAASRHARLLRPHGLDATPIVRAGEIVFPSAAVRKAPAPVAEVAPTLAVANVAAPSTVDTALEDAIDRHVKALRRSGRVAADEVTSWLVFDLENDRTLASINADAPRQAASMIKPLVMLAFFHEANGGRFIYGSVSRGKLEAMIQRSSNTSTNWTIDQLGGPAGVQRVLDAHYGDLLRNTSVVERIGPGGRTYRNKASVADYGRYLRALWRDELPFAKEQRRILGLWNGDRIFQGAPSIPSGTLVYDKTGSTARCCGNMGILVARRRSGGRFPYVFCGVIEKSRRASPYGSWVSVRSDVIRSVSDLSYRHLKALYGLA